MTRFFEFNSVFNVYISTLTIESVARLKVAVKVAVTMKILWSKSLNFLTRIPQNAPAFIEQHKS